MAQNGLLDFLQSASNTAADSVAAPVDLLAWALRKAGVPVPQNALGGSEWLKQQGLKRDVPQSAAALAGETVGLLSPMVAAAKAPQIAKGLLQVEANAMAPTTLRPEAGAIVWHGSPHKFDRFDSSKIGTGEGAQAYGRGIYTAEAPGVASSYRRAGETAAPIQYKGQGIMNWAIGNRDAVKALPKETQDALAWARDHVSLDDAFTAAIAYDKPAIEKEIQRLVRAGDLKMAPEGHLYKVDLPDPLIARMLDWDKPLAQNPQPLRDVFAAAMKKDGYESYAVDGQRVYLGLGEEATLKGQDAYRRLHEHAIRSGKAEPASVKEAEMVRWLRNAGVPGVRYLDGSSRGAGAGTSNFVVFPGEESALRILERNGGLLAP